MTHTFIDESRRAHRRQEVLVTESTATANDPGHLADLEVREVVRSALGGLAPRMRAVVVLRHWLDLDVAETARILGCSAGTVKSPNAKALARLRDVLGPVLDTSAPTSPIPALTQESL